MQISCLAYSCTLETEATRFSEMRVGFKHAKMRYISEDTSLHGITELETMSGDDLTDRKNVRNGPNIKLWQRIVQIYVIVLYQKSRRETEEKHEKY